MPLDNYENLKESIKRRSKRDDITDSDLVDYIVQCETEFYNNAISPLRVRSMEARATSTVSTSERFLALPDRFLFMRRLKLNDPYSGGPDTDIRYMSPEQMPLKNLTAIPIYFTVTSQIEFDSTPDQAYTVEMQYIQKLTPLSTANDTNAILTDYPTVYLYGALWALFTEVQDYEVAADYYQKFINAIQGANASDQAGRYGAAPVVRSEGYNP